jgi:hypothetical protein
MHNVNYATRFILKQKQFMRNGFTEQQAFEETEKLFQERMRRKLD